MTDGPRSLKGLRCTSFCALSMSLDQSLVLLLFRSSVLGACTRCSFLADIRGRLLLPTPLFAVACSNYMNIKDDETRKTMWESKSWDKTFEEELKIEVPKEILSLKAVSRELNFSSKELIKDFRIVQSVSLMGNPLEVWSFKFGFVIPDSTNSWENIIEAAGTLTFCFAGCSIASLVWSWSTLFYLTPLDRTLSLSCAGGVTSCALAFCCC